MIKSITIEIKSFVFLVLVTVVFAVGCIVYHGPFYTLDRRPIVRPVVTYQRSAIDDQVAIIDAVITQERNLLSGTLDDRERQSFIQEINQAENAKIEIARRPQR